MRISIERMYRGTLFFFVLLLAAPLLLAQESPFGPRAMTHPRDDLTSIRGVILETIAPGSWVEAGGGASIVAVNRWDLLVVRQNERNHKAIEDLLNTLQKAVSVRNGDSDTTSVPIYEADDETQQKELEKIRAELAKETKIDFLDEPLSDAIRYLEQLHGIQIEIDGRAPNEGRDRPINKQLSGISLRSALDLILRDHGLTFTLHDGVLLITTPDIGESYHLTRVYGLSKLVSQ